MEQAIIIVATERPPAVAVLDRLSGKVLWQVLLKDAPTTGPVLYKSTIYVGTDTGTAALELVDGSPVWEKESGAPSGPLTLRKGRLAYVSKDTQLVLVHLDSGEIVNVVSGSLPDVPPVLSREAILFASGTGLARYDVTKGQSSPWARTSWLGQVASPIVLANSRVYFGTEHRGLVCFEEKRRR
jgi:outer membrane protein assembly factor BamB